MTADIKYDWPIIALKDNPIAVLQYYFGGEVVFAQVERPEFFGKKRDLDKFISKVAESFRERRLHQEFPEIFKHFLTDEQQGKYIEGTWPEKFEKQLFIHEVRADEQKTVISYFEDDWARYMAQAWLIRNQRHCGKDLPQDVPSSCSILESQNFDYFNAFEQADSWLDGKSDSPWLTNIGISAVVIVCDDDNNEFVLVTKRPASALQSPGKIMCGFTDSPDDSCIENGSLSLKKAVREMILGEEMGLSFGNHEGIEVDTILAAVSTNTQMPGGVLNVICRVKGLNREDVDRMMETAHDSHETSDHMWVPIESFSDFVAGLVQEKLDPFTGKTHEESITAGNIEYVSQLLREYGRQKEANGTPQPDVSWMVPSSSTRTLPGTNVRHALLAEMTTARNLA